MTIFEVALVTFLSTYAFSLTVDLGRAGLEFLFNLFPRNKLKKLPPVTLTPEQAAVIIPCHNSADSIANPLETLPVDYKVYCVANACSDNTVEILNSFSGRFGDNLKIIETEKPGKITAVLRGAVRAKKDGLTHFILLDDDVIWPVGDDDKPMPVSSYDPDAPLTALPVLPAKSPNWLTAAQTIEYQLMCTSKRAQGNLGNTIMASGAAGIFRLDTFPQLMSFHNGEHIGDDLQCAYIHHAKDARIDFNSQLLIRTQAPETMAQWWRQRTKRWEVSSVFNSPWALKAMFHNVWGSPGWWIRGVIGYRFAVIFNDFFRAASLPLTIAYSPIIVGGVWGVTYLSVCLKLLVYRIFYRKNYNPKWDKILFMTLLTYPLYTALMWISRIAAVPRGLYLNWKYYKFGFRLSGTLKPFIEDLERREPNATD